MNKDFFEKQIGRLAETYGANIYKPERLILIWNEVEKLSDEWFEQLVSHFIGSTRNAPLLQEIREFAIREREELWQLEKIKNRNEAKEFFSSYSPDDVKAIVQVIIKRMNGAVSDEDWIKFQAQIDSIAKNSEKSKCRYCRDSGLLHAKHLINKCSYTFLCHCEIGMRDKRKFEIGKNLSEAERKCFEFDFERGM